MAARSGGGRDISDSPWWGGWQRCQAGAGATGRLSCWAAHDSATRTREYAAIRKNGKEFKNRENPLENSPKVLDYNYILSIVLDRPGHSRGAARAAAPAVLAARDRLEVNRDDEKVLLVDRSHNVIRIWGNAQRLSLFRFETRLLWSRGSTPSHRFTIWRCNLAVPAQHMSDPLLSSSSNGGDDTTITIRDDEMRRKRSIHTQMKLMMRKNYLLK